MRRISVVGIVVCAIAVVLWGLSQVGGEPRFSKVDSVQQVSNDGQTITRTGEIGSELLGERPIVKSGPGNAQGLPVLPTIGPPPDGSHLPNAGEPRDIAPVPGVVPHISRFASTGAPKWTRLRQILVEAGENEAAADIGGFQELLKQSRRGADVTADELVEAQEALIIQVEGMLTGSEVNELLGELQSAVEAMQAAELTGQGEEEPAE